MRSSPKGVPSLFFGRPELPSLFQERTLKQVTDELQGIYRRRFIRRTESKSWIELSSDLGELLRLETSYAMLKDDRKRVQEIFALAEADIQAHSAEQNGCRCAGLARLFYKRPGAAGTAACGRRSRRFGKDRRADRRRDRTDEGGRLEDTAAPMLGSSVRMGALSLAKVQERQEDCNACPGDISAKWAPCFPLSS